MCTAAALRSRSHAPIGFVVLALDTVGNQDVMKRTQREPAAYIKEHSSRGELRQSQPVDRAAASITTVCLTAMGAIAVKGGAVSTRFI